MDQVMNAAASPMKQRLGVEGGLRSSIIRVDHLCCGMESKLIRDMLCPLETVVEVKISLTDRRLNVEHADSLTPEQIVDMLNAKHLGASIQDKAMVETVGSSFNLAEAVRVGVNALQIGLFAVVVGLSMCGQAGWVRDALSWTCVALSVALFHEAYLAVRRMSPNVELMMAVAMGGALLQGDTVEAASVGALVTLMDLVKVFALEAVERKLRGSIISDPLTVDVPGGVSVLLSDLAVGDVYVLRVGDVVPADGLVDSGNATVDESRVTGEAMPQAKRKGDKVHSGSIVSNGFLQVRTESPVAASFKARVADTVADAKNTLSETEAVVGRFATWYTPTVLILAIALGLYRGWDQFLVVIVAGCPCALLGAAPFVQGATLSLLAGHHRLLIKRATTLESLANIRAIGFDKTGTLTTGQFELLRMEVLPGVDMPKETMHEWVAAVEDLDNHPLARSLVASFKGCIGDFVAAGRSLPPASGFKRHGRDGVSATVDGRLVGVGNSSFLHATVQGADGGGDPHLRDARAAHAAATKAIEAAEKDQMPKRMIASLRKRETAALEAVKAAEAAAPGSGDAGAAPSKASVAATRAKELSAEWAGSGTVLFVTLDASVAAVLLMDDAVKEDAAPVVRELAQLGVRSVILTGDRLAAAQRVAKAVGIPEADIHANLLPDDKQRHILEMTWQDDQRTTTTTATKSDLEANFLPKATRGPVEVGFVGDGLNDCPALASAHVGVVLQEVGSQATVDAASAVLQVDIDQLPAAIIIARRSRRLVLVNLFLALSINVAVILLAATIGLPLWLSVLSDSGGLLVVLANSLWPLTWRVGDGAPARPRTSSVG